MIMIAGLWMTLNEAITRLVSWVSQTLAQYFFVISSHNLHTRKLHLPLTIYMYIYICIYSWTIHFFLSCSSYFVHTTCVILRCTTYNISNCIYTFVRMTSPCVCNELFVSLRMSTFGRIVVYTEQLPTQLISWKLIGW